MQVFGQVVPLVVAAHALRETLRRNVTSGRQIEFQAVLALHPADVFGKLVQVLNGRLRSIPTRSDLQEAGIVHIERGERAQPRKAKFPEGVTLEKRLNPTRTSLMRFVVKL